VKKARNIEGSGDLPECFARLDKVFPVAENGLRVTPEACFPCPQRVHCLRSALDGTEGLVLQEELVDRAYRKGLMGFLDRWSKKKGLHRRMEKARKAKE